LPRDRSPAIPLLGAALALAAAASVFLGRYPTPGLASIREVFSDPLAARLVLTLRIPRIIAALLLGATLAAAGTVFQMIFANPLVEPGFLGVSQGAGFGAALCIVAVSASPAAVQASAFVFALAGLALSWILARAFRFGGWILRLVLAGIAVSSLFSAGIGALKMAADPLRQLPEITFWLLGGLWSVSWRQVWFLLPPVAAGLAAVTALRWRLNVLSLDDRVAHSLGTAPERERLGLLLAATLATSSAVAVSGLVAWIGLLAPHAARRLVGTDARRALPAGMLLGALVVLVCDDIARTALPAEIPLGILTSLVGAAGFAALMATSGSRRGG
jgi:iron complex transport system permease protein